MSALRCIVLAIGVASASALALACDPSASNGAAASVTEGGGNCATCHMPDYERAADPVHVDVKPTKCVVCHGQEGWRPSALNHPYWALTGAHEKAPCMYCHGHKDAPDVFKGTTKDCFSCHKPEYDSSTYPGHSTFPTKCADCHTTKAFRPATYTPPPPPPPPPPPIATVPALVNGRPVKLLPGQKAPPTRPGVPPPVSPPPRVPPPPPPPPPRPTPDVISRPSPRR